MTSLPPKHLVEAAAKAATKWFALRPCRGTAALVIDAVLMLNTLEGATGRITVYADLDFESDMSRPLIIAG